MNNSQDRLNKIEELLNMAAFQTSENAKQLEVSNQKHDKEMSEIRRAHKELQALVKNLIIKIAY
jgi:hypothetical protein